MDDVSEAGDMSLSRAALEFRLHRHKLAAFWVELRRQSPVVARIVHRRYKVAQRLAGRVAWAEFPNVARNWLA
jgi:hypothetical protein